MRVTFQPAAQKEMFESVAYYEQKDHGLGSKFLYEIDSTLSLISAYPESGTLLNAYARRVLLKGFPFGVVYRIYNNQIVILAIMHLRRKPNYWVKRS
ncbi:ParE toxin of type II toxin-antitoxin system, parDE [Cyclonatronum proteinivorum]|uniref:ParE toxin of type II toxin-antitoxin system, parDE n=1 Tax=Cyclonatronum proteinivorum TaxID=1457365 RepID=A0A345UPU9_9BACT|nr:ParE toxin of type II toxin-antitoxin system, parDE [Cyclonatronum proteinivorum]